MRYEQIIAAVTRSLANAEVREIPVVEKFAVAMRLHLWLLRTSLGMPSYPGSDPSSLDDAGRRKTGRPGLQCGTLSVQPAWITGSCPAGFASA
jgi:hypothetical protein